MKFLVVIFGLILLYWPRFFVRLQRDRWFFRWQQWLAGRAGGIKAPGLVMAVTLALPVLGLWWLLAGLQGEFFGLPYFFANVLVLLYAFGRGDSREQVDVLLEDLHRGDMQAAFHDLAFFTTDGKAGESEDPRAFTEELKARLAYSYFERHLAVVFWFMVAGAPLALLYRLSVLYQQNAQGADASASPGGKWLWLMEWLPLRVVGFTLALVGHFQAALGRWRELLFSGLSSPRVLLAVVNAALGPVPAGAASDDQSGDDQSGGAGGEAAGQVVKEVESLFYNTIVCWLVLISLVLILS